MIKNENIFLKKYPECRETQTHGLNLDSYTRYPKG